jgi:hypothetical protein
LARTKNDDLDPLVPISGKRLERALDLARLPQTAALELLAAHGVHMTQGGLSGIVRGKQRRVRTSVRAALEAMFGNPAPPGSWLGGDGEDDLLDRALWTSLGAMKVVHRQPPILGPNGEIPQSNFLDPSFWIEQEYTDVERHFFATHMVRAMAVLNEATARNSQSLTKPRRR